MILYLAHSIPATRKGFVDGLSSLARELGLELRIAERPWNPPEAMPEHVSRSIAESDCYVAWMIKDGPYLYYANQEGRYIREHCPDKPGVLFVGKDVLAPATLQSYPQISFDFSSAGKSQEQVTALLEKKGLAGRCGPEQIQQLASFLQKSISLMAQ